MDGLNATLNIIASALAVLTSVLSFYMVWREVRKKPKDDSKPGQSGAGVGPKPEG